VVRSSRTRPRESSLRGQSRLSTLPTGALGPAASSLVP